MKMLLLGLVVSLVSATSIAADMTGKELKARFTNYGIEGETEDGEACEVGLDSQLDIVFKLNGKVIMSFPIQDHDLVSLQEEGDDDYYAEYKWGNQYKFEVAHMDDAYDTMILTNGEQKLECGTEY